MTRGASHALASLPWLVAGFFTFAMLVTGMVIPQGARQPTTRHFGATLAAAPISLRAPWVPALSSMLSDTILARTLVAEHPAAPQSGSFASATEAPSGHFAWPVNPHVILRRFDPPSVKWGAGHRGVDLGTSDDAPVTAPADGVVTFSGVIAGVGVVSIRHPEGFNTTYEPVTDRVAQGSVVKRGQRIATVAPGHCPTTCLHWGYKVGDGLYRDPLTLVGAAHPVLLTPFGGS